MKLDALLQKQADARARALAIHNKANGENRLPTEEEQKDFDAATAEAKSYDAHIARAREAQDLERNSPSIPAAKTGTHNALAGASEAEKAGFPSLGAQLLAVKEFYQSRGNRKDSRLFATATGQNETVDAEGGFLLQADFAPDFLTRTFAADEIVKRCRTRPVSSSRLVLNGLEDSNRVGGYTGAGIVVQRVAEADPAAFSKLKFRRVELNMNKLMCFYKATDEILEDAPALQADVNDVVPAAFSWRLGNEVINGTGAGEFLGINQSRAVVVVAKDAGQAADTITAQNILNMKQRLWIRSRANAVWVTGPDVEAQLRLLTIPGPQGTAVAMYTPPGMNGNNSQYGMLEGIPVIVVEQTAQLGTQGDIMLCDFDQFVIGERNGLKVATSIHVAFLTDEQVFRWTLRNDGQPLWDKPVTQNNSANKVSPFVVLATRG